MADQSVGLKVDLMVDHWAALTAVLMVAAKADPMAAQTAGLMVDPMADS